MKYIAALFAILVLIATILLATSTASSQGVVRPTVTPTRFSAPPADVVFGPELGEAIESAWALPWFPASGSGQPMNPVYQMFPTWVSFDCPPAPSLCITRTPGSMNIPTPNATPRGSAIMPTPFTSIVVTIAPPNVPLPTRTPASPPPGLVPFPATATP